ncbi:hypothetical protein KJ966_03410 [bacterium]|nr:hypothetical protein [bacterium]
MTNIDKKQVEKLLEDVASIKSAIDSNRPLIKQLLLPIHFRIISLIAGMAFIVLSSLYYFLLNQYGDYSGIPIMIRTILIAIIAVLYIALIVLKRVLWVKSVKKIDQQITFGQLVKSFYRFQLIHVWIPIILLLLFVSIYLYLMDGQQYIVPIIAIGVGIIYNSIGSVTRIKQYIITGYWLIITGILPLLFPTVSALIYLALSMGCGLLLFTAISGTKDSENSKE